MDVSLAALVANTFLITQWANTASAARVLGPAGESWCSAIKAALRNEPCVLKPIWILS